MYIQIKSQEPLKYQWYKGLQDADITVWPQMEIAENRHKLSRQFTLPEVQPDKGDMAVFTPFLKSP